MHRPTCMLRTVLFSLLIVLASLAPVRPTSAASDRLPDLGMAQLTNIRIQTAVGRRLLRFDTRIVNIGVGTFELRGTRPTTSTPEMAVVQRIYDDGGGSRDQALSADATMFYSGDGHDHWHLHDLQVYELERLDNGIKVGMGAKEGFCFFDNVKYRLTLPGAPPTAVYTYSAAPPACGYRQPTALQAVMGLSIGWGDLYNWNLPGQYIDITGLPAGRYRLKVSVNATPLGLSESNANNNVTWADLQLQGTGGGVRILGYGPSA